MYRPMPLLLHCLACLFWLIFLFGLPTFTPAPPSSGLAPCLAPYLGPYTGHAHAALARKNEQTVSLDDTWNPHPDTADIVLPMPGGIGMAFRLVVVPASGLLGDMIFRPGIVATDDADRAYYDRPYTSALSAPFTLADLPASWLPAARQAIDSIYANRRNGANGLPDNQASGSAPNGSDLNANGQTGNKHFFYLIGKYEVSRQQWQAIMRLPVSAVNCQSLTSPQGPSGSPGDFAHAKSGWQAGVNSKEKSHSVSAAVIADSSLPKLKFTETSGYPDQNIAPAADANAAMPITEISWFDAVEFSRRYTVWLLANHPTVLPRFAGDSRNTGYLRLPTESEWEYAARGGHKAGMQLLREDFFALPEGGKRSDYAVYRPENALRIPAGAAMIGSRKPNPLGLYDTAGNVAEMVMDCFRFSVGGRLHGSAGGFVRKGGSWFSGDSAILPGRREEIPFFLASGPANARDMGLRLVISGTNTPGGPRPDALHAEWKKAGEGPSIVASRARNPLEELDRLLVMTTDQTTRKNLLALRDTIKEGNIMRERQLELEAETVFGTGAYMIETIRNYYSRSAVLETQIARLEGDREQETGKGLEKLEQILDNARRGRKQLETSLNRSLAFYQTKVEDSASLDPEVARAASENVARDYGGDGPFDQNMRRNLELFVTHVEAWRKGRGIPREKLKTEILEKRFR